MRVARRLARGLALLLGGLLLAACALHLANSGQGELPRAAPQVLRVATHNVHYILANRATGPWSRGDWERRREALDAVFKATEADLVAFQEMETFEGSDDDTVNLARDWLLERNPGYRAAAVGDWRSFPSTQPILYREAELRLVDQGWFFFSETPDVIYSRTFNGSWPAFASWVEFERRSDGRRFHVFNLHFEYRSRSNRLLSAALVRDRIAPVVAEGGAVFVLGDLNDLRGSRTMRTIEAAGVAFLDVPGATYHMDRGVNVLPAIDHVGHAGPARPVGGAVVLRDRPGGVWPSDHYPVVADFALAAP